MIKMDETKDQNFRDLISTNDVFPIVGVRNDQSVVKYDDDDDSISTTSSFEDDSTNSIGSSSSSDLLEDASSLSTSCSSFESSSPSLQFSNKGPLYELSELMNQLPIKRGLSKHFQGKSQSFTSLSNVKCLEDLAKKESPYRKKMMIKACKSCGGGLDNTQKSYTPKACCSKIISKKASNRGGSFSSLLGKRNGFIINNGGLIRPPVHE